MNPLVIIGLDGATFSVIDNHRDRLPTLSRLIDTGYAADLVSTQPAITSVAWPAFVTGQNPAQYGFFDFMQRDPSSLEFSINDVRRRELDFFWDYLDAEVGIASFPMIPYRGVDGFFIQGSLARVNANRITKPASLDERIPDAYDNLIDPSRDKDETVADTFDRIAAREDVFTDLVAEYDLDVYLLMFSAIDHVQHHFWAYHDDTHPAHEPSKYVDFILEVYERVDEAVGAILSEFSDPNVVLASDHGFGQKRAEVNVNAVLADKGYLSYADDLELGLANRIWSLKSIIGDTPLYRLVPEFVKETAKSNLPSHNDIVDIVGWDETEAYSFGAGGNIYLNLDGRERDGTVPTEDYESVRAELIETLESVVDPKTGERIIESAEPREAVYEGPYFEQAPDVVLRPTPGYHLNPTLGREPITHRTSPMRDTGMHLPSGIFIANGPGFRTGERGPQRSISDVAPTLLHLLGNRIPTGMAGEPITDGLVTENEPVRESVRIPERTQIRRRILMLKQLDRL